MSPNESIPNPAQTTNGTSSGAPRIQLGPDRSVVRGAGNSVRHVVVTITAPEAVQAPDVRRQPLNLALVVDVSGSMQGRPLQAACEGAALVVERLTADDRLSLVSFASDVVVHASAVRLDDAGKAMVLATLRELTTRGSTDLCAGWLAGCEAVATRLAFANGSERNHVVVLSDGHANQGVVAPEQLAAHASELRQRGVLTSTVGIGVAYSPIQLQAISEAGGGRMHDAERPEEIAEVLLAELADTLATTVENLQVALRLPPLVRAELYGTAPTVHEGGEYRVQLGSMLSGATRHVVVKLTFPAGVVGARAELGARASWRIPGEAAEHSIDLPPCDFRFGGGSECAAQPRDLERARIVLSHWQAHVLHRAMALNQSGDLLRAFEFVAGELRHYERYCQGVPGAESMLETLHAYLPSMRHRQGSVSAKEMMLASYKLSRGEADRRSAARGSIEEQVHNLLRSIGPF